MSKPIKDFLSVAKPGIVFGNLVSATGGFLLASKGRPDIPVLLSTVTGISLVVASGCILNNYADRHIDRKMVRTRNRPLAKGTISPKTAVFYASFLGIAGMTLLSTKSDILSAAVVLTGLAIYVGAYTLYLKRNSIYGTLIGSLAGAAPALAGYCAASHRFDTGAVVVLSIFVFWQVPHSYSIAIFQVKDYAAAAVPVMPVKRGISSTKRHILGYILAFAAASLMPTFCGYTGYGYFVVAFVMGLTWVCMAWSGPRTSDDRIWAKRMYVFSILCIFSLSFMMSIDFTGPAASKCLRLALHSSASSNSGQSGRSPNPLISTRKGPNSFIEKSIFIK